jgi:hypothetical protein
VEQIVQIKNFISGSYKAQSLIVGNEICRNLYVENANGKSVLRGRPGYVSRWNIGEGPIRMLYFERNRCWAVSGGNLYELFSDHTSILRGTILDDQKKISYASNRFQLGLVSGSKVYMHDLATNGLAAVPDIELAQIVFADGYFAGLTPDSQIFKLSGQYDGIVWDPLDFTSAEGDPDDITGIIANHRQIWTFGQRSIEPFYDSGNSDFPYERVEGALIQCGCPAKESIIQQDNALFFLGTNDAGGYSFFRAQGYTPLWISNHGLDEELATYADVSDCIGYPIRIAGHAFCVWHFPTADKTWVYDCATQTFSEWSYWDVTHSLWNRFRGQVHCFAWGKHLVGDYLTGNIYELSPTINDDNGDARRWMRGLPLGISENKYLFPANLEVLAEVGEGIAEADTSDDPGNPQAVLRYSKDGGYTFGSEKKAYLGKVGQYDYRCRFPGPMGQARKPYIELSGSDPVRIALTDAFIDIGEGVA